MLILYRAPTQMNMMPLRASAATSETCEAIMLSNILPLIFFIRNVRQKKLKLPSERISINVMKLVLISLTVHISDKFPLSTTTSSLIIDLLAILLIIVLSCVVDSALKVEVFELILAILERSTACSLWPYVFPDRIVCFWRSPLGTFPP